MRRLKTHGEAPPVDGEGHSYRYTHETGHVSWASDWTTWRDKIKEHRVANGLNPIDMAVAEDQLCATLPPERCLYETGDSMPVDIDFAYSDVADWVKAIVAKFTSGADYVEQAEAERRAEICVRCPMNVVSRGCSSCAKLAELLTPGMGKRSTKEDDRLKNCGVCKCYNRIQVHFPLDVLREGDTNHAYPDWCWRK